MRTLMILDAGTAIDEVLGTAALRVYGPLSVFIQSVRNGSVGESGIMK